MYKKADSFIPTKCALVSRGSLSASICLLYSILYNSTASMTTTSSRPQRMSTYSICFINWTKPKATPSFASLWIASLPPLQGKCRNRPVNNIEHSKMICIWSKSDCNSDWILVQQQRFEYPFGMHEDQDYWSKIHNWNLQSKTSRFGYSFRSGYRTQESFGREE